MRSSQLWLVVLLLSAALLPHLSTLRADFTYDDRVYVMANPGIRSLAKAITSYTQSWPPNDDRNRRLYRPTTQLSYALDYALGGGTNPAFFHGMNLLLYWLTLLCIFLVARHYLQDWPYSLVVALLFACHPIHCEVVDSVTGRSEMLALLFGLLCWYSFLRFEKHLRLGWLLLSGLCYLLAATSKETGVMFAALLVAHVWFHPLSSISGAPPSDLPGAQRKRWLGVLGIVSLTPLYLVVRHFALSGHFIPGHTLLGDSPISHRILSIGRIFVEYCKLMFAPLILQIDPYYEAVVGITTRVSALSLLGLCLLFLLVGYLIIHIRRPAETPVMSSGAHKGTVPFLVASFLLLYFPISQVIPIGALMAERLMYSASLPFLLLLVVVSKRFLDKLESWQKRRFVSTVALVLLGLILVLFSIRAGFRARDWQTPLSLWTSAAAHASHFSIHKNLGTVYLTHKKYGLAQQQFQHAVRLNPGDAVSWFNLGALEEKRHRISAAIRFYRIALKINPQDNTTRARLLHCQEQLDKARKLIQLYLPMLHSTNNIDLLQRLGGACVIVGNYRCATTAVRRINKLK